MPKSKDVAIKKAVGFSQPSGGPVRPNRTAAVGASRVRPAGERNAQPSGSQGGDGQTPPQKLLQATVPVVGPHARGSDTDGQGMALGAAPRRLPRMASTARGGGFKPLSPEAAKRSSPAEMRGELPDDPMHGRSSG